MTIKLGDKARDKISGFEGTVIAQHVYLNGCVRFSIQPNELKDGKRIESDAFDVEQIELVQADQHAALARSGGPEHTPSRPSIPAR